MNAHYRSLHAYHSSETSGPQRLFQIILLGQPPLTLDPPTTVAFLQGMAQQLHTLQQDAEAYSAQWLEPRLQTMTLTAEPAIDAYLDWYYSLSGSYTRLFFAATGDLDLLLSAQMETLIFEQGNLDQRLNTHYGQLQQEYTQALIQFLQTRQETSLDALLAEFRPQGIDAIPADATLARIELPTPLSRDLTANKAMFESHIPAAVHGLVGGTVLGLGIRSALLSRLLSTPASVSARAVTQRYLHRLPAQLSARAATGAGAGAASGPLALFIGTGVFVAGIGVDWGMLKREEGKYRQSQKDAFLFIVQDYLHQQQAHIQQAQQAYFETLHRSLTASYQDGPLATEFRVF